ncbi:hypothetical protein Aglo01_64150 [Actinokineospora globicatena]|nr:hypothetical protein Aglo01_64150 [Actinokineospora globicatena]GLW88728.1 hypothetical protein Aglo02_63670 [Actinokineospora globicatena]
MIIKVPVRGPGKPVHFGAYWTGPGVDGGNQPVRGGGRGAPVRWALPVVDRSVAVPFRRPRQC